MNHLFWQFRTWPNWALHVARSIEKKHQSCNRQLVMFLQLCAAYLDGTHITMVNAFSLQYHEAGFSFRCSGMSGLLWKLNGKGRLEVWAWEVLPSSWSLQTYRNRWLIMVDPIFVNHPPGTLKAWWFTMKYDDIWGVFIDQGSTSWWSDGKPSRHVLQIWWKLLASFSPWEMSKPGARWLGFTVSPAVAGTWS